MNTPKRARRDEFRRKTHYVDESLQKFFLLALVLLEIILVGGLTWLMWSHLNQIIDDNLYRVHLQDSPSILSLLLREAAFLLTLFFVANLCALIVANLIWQRYVTSILQSFLRLIRKTQALDFTADQETSGKHQIISLMATQRRQERQRLMQIRSRLDSIKSTLAAAGSQPALADSLRALRQLLPSVASPGTAQRSQLRRHGDTF